MSPAKRITIIIAILLVTAPLRAQLPGTQAPNGLFGNITAQGTSTASQFCFLQATPFCRNSWPGGASFPTLKGLVGTDSGGNVIETPTAKVATNYAVGSSTGGIQEAINAAGSNNEVIIPPGTYAATAKITETNNEVAIYGYGATVQCNKASADDCFMIGTTGNPTTTTGVTIYGLHLAPGPNSAANSGFRDNAQNTHFIDVGGTGQYTCSGWCGFYHFLENDDDQAEVVDHLFDMNPAATILTCTASACGSALWAPGPFTTNAGITWIKNSNLSMGCSGNSIDWQSGNHLTVSDSILQAYSQFAARVSYSSSEFDGLNHWERGSCVNPLNDGNGHALGGASLLLVDGSAEVHGASPVGTLTTVFSTNAPGSTTYQYYIVANKGGTGQTLPLPIGYLTNGPATIDGSHYNFTLWPALSTTVTYDMLRETNGRQAPYGTGLYAVATGLLPASVCGSNGVCSFTDNVTTLGSYTTPIGNIAKAIYAPSAPFWPGDLVLMNQASEAANPAGLLYQGPSAAGGVVVNTAAAEMGINHVVYNAGTDGKYSSDVLPVMPGLAYAPGAFDTADGNIWPLLFPPYAAGNYQGYAQQKGMVNFLGATYPGTPTDLITANDSNFGKTLSTNAFRPVWDAGDSALSIDGPTGTEFAARAGRSWSTYINHLPDDKSWASRTYSTGVANSIPFYGLKTIGVGTPVSLSVSDVTSATVWQASHFYTCYSSCPQGMPIIYDGTNWQELVWPGTSGATAPTWATTPGNQTQDGTAVWVSLGASSLAVNTTYDIKVASATPSGYSAPTSELTVTTANDAYYHLILVSENHNYPTIGATGYQAGCSTTTGTEQPISPPYTGAYNTGPYAYFPVMNCSGSGNFNTGDKTGSEIIAGNLQASGAMNNGITTATNSDNRGHITLSGGTGSYTFTQGPGSAGVWTTAPVCIIQDDTTMNNITTSSKAVSTSTLTITGSVGTGDTYSYICWPGN